MSKINSKSTKSQVQEVADSLANALEEMEPEEAAQSMIWAEHRMVEAGLVLGAIRHDRPTTFALDLIGSNPAVLDRIADLKAAGRWVPPSLDETSVQSLIEAIV